MGYFSLPLDRDSSFPLFFKIEEELIYCVLLISGRQQSNSVIHVSALCIFFRFFSIIGYYKVINVVPYVTQSPFAFPGLSSYAAFSFSI